MSGYIDRQTIVDMITNLEAQKQNALNVVQQCEGALKLCNAWLAQVDKELADLQARAELAMKAAESAKPEQVDTVQHQE